MAKKILIVEDEEMLGGLYQQKFKQAGFITLLSDNAKQAYQMAKEEKPDLVLLDMLLPEESGLICLEELKKDSTTAEIPVVAFSNFDDLATRKQAKSLGILAYLIKSSYTPKEIVEKVKKYLGN